MEQGKKNMKLKTIGEFGFIERIAQVLNADIPSSFLGIGDDCAVIPLDGSRSLLITTDMLVEDVHFLRSKISAADLGYKSLAVNLSDIAAMGGIPQCAFISLGLPSDVEVEWLDEWYSAFHTLAREYDVAVLGGDTTKSPDRLVINIALCGFANTDHLKYRSSALVGDIICVTDYVGDSAGGLRVLLENIEPDASTEFLLQRHHRPTPHLAEGQWLSKHSSVHAMIDVSDGIDSDIRRIAERSHCGAGINLDAVPVSDSLQKVAQRYHWNVREMAVTGGEDYCLLLTVDASGYPALARDFEEYFRRPLWAIGTILSPEQGIQYYSENTTIHLNSHGFDHFQ